MPDLLWPVLSVRNAFPIIYKLLADFQTVDKPSIKSTSRILLLDGGSLDRVRNWTGQDVWENRVSSLTAENVDWLRGQLTISSCGHSES